MSSGAPVADPALRRDGAAPAAPGRALEFAIGRKRRILGELEQLVRIPSVSAQPVRERDVRRCAHWLADHLRRIGLERVAVVPTGRHPAVLAHGPHQPGRPGVLVYGHYDVQPVDPVAAWRTPPFEPAVRGDLLYGRGSCDDKGQLFAHVKALEAYLATERALPVNVTCLFDGEEEIGSPSLALLLRRRRRELAADVAVMSDTRMLGPDRPAITYALRGSLGLELEVEGPRGELHSGNFGGAVHNPVQALCEIVARLQDERRRVAVPGFYKDVRRLTPRERNAMRHLGASDVQIARDAGVERPWGEPGYTLYERTTVRPALIVNGIGGGYQGPGGKSIVPARATAKLQLRLVPEQDPAEIERLVRQHIAALTPPTVRSVVRSAPGTRAVVVDRRHPAMRAAVAAYERSFGAQPAFIRSGGTIPVVGLLEDLYGIPTVMMGFALPSSRIHAPNENLHLPTFFRGISASVWFLHELARLSLPALSGSRSDHDWAGRRPSASHAR